MLLIIFNSNGINNLGAINSANFIFMINSAEEVIKQVDLASYLLQST